MEKIKYLEPDELDNLFFCVEQKRLAWCVRDSAIFRLAEYLALRISEVTMLKIAEYKPEKREIYVHRAKGSIPHTYRIVDTRVVDALEEWILERNVKHITHEALFVSQQNRAISPKTLDLLMRSYGESAELPMDKRHFHVLRHTRAIELGNLGFDIKDIQWWLGHTNIENTLIYARFTTIQQEHMYKRLDNSCSEFDYSDNDEWKVRALLKFIQEDLPRMKPLEIRQGNIYAQIEQKRTK